MKLYKERNSGCVPYNLLDCTKNDDLDVEAGDCCLRGFCTVDEREFYRKKYVETLKSAVNSGYFDGYPEWWACTGYSKEELDFTWVLHDK
ncbi:MAG: hypothetical protein PHH48_06515 [Eubacteriales bacterium]|nr:hypothetical protein [Eubacteriales bacterium]